MAWTPDWQRARRLTLRALVALSLLVFLAWLGLPPLVRGVAQSELSKVLGRAVRVGSVRVNPLTLTLSVDGLQVAAAQAGQPPALDVAQLEASVSASSIWHGAPVIDKLRIDAPHLRVTRLAPGHYDFDDVLAHLQAARTAPAEPATGPARLALYNLLVTQGALDVDDRPAQRQHHLKDLRLGLPFLSTLNDHAVNITVEPRLSFQLDGAMFDTGAQATPFSRDHSAKLALRSGGIALEDWLPYLPAQLPVRPTAGKLSADLRLQFAAPPGQAPTVILQGDLSANGLRLADRAGAELAALDLIEVHLDDVQPLRRQVSLGAIRLNGATLNVSRDAQGRLNWLKTLQDAPATAAPDVAGPPAPAASGQDTGWHLRAGRLDAKRVALNWHDDAPRPGANLLLRDGSLQAFDLSWPLSPKVAAHGLLDATLVVPGRQAMAAGRTASPSKEEAGGETLAPGRLHLEARLDARGGDAKGELAGWDLAGFSPYLRAYFRPRVEGQLSMALAARWSGMPGDSLPALTLTSLRLERVRVVDPNERKGLPLAQWQSLALSDGALDPKTRELTLGHLAWRQPRAAITRDPAGALNLQQWLVTPAPSGPARSTGSAAAPTWHLLLKDADVSEGQVQWHDQATGGAPVTLGLLNVKFAARDLRWPAAAKAWVAVNASASLGLPGSAKQPKGRIDWRGQVGLQPLAWRGRAQAERFPVHLLAPYFEHRLPWVLQHATADWRGDVSGQLTAKGLRLGIKGAARLNDLQVNAKAGDAGPGDPLLSWQALALDGVQVDLAPGERPRVVVAQGTLADFYAALLITEQGRFNLNDLAAVQAAEPASSAPSVAAAASSTASAAPVTAMHDGFPLDLTVGGVKLLNGKVDFADHFIRPHYSAAVTELNGTLGGFRSGSADMAALDLSGKVAGTAQLAVHGALNPTAHPLALDIQAKASDLDLSPLSPYSGKYAGYAIERGKLTMDVHYKIQPDGKLDASNKIVLNQLTFGDPVASPDATHLPVRLAVSLLKDRNGVIDLNLPIGGSINDPQFSVGRLIIKVIVNLLTKALTSPFSLLSGGGSDNLSVVPFEPGTAVPTATSPAVLDKVAQALADRPALQLTLNGTADATAEHDALQAAQLQARLLAQQRKVLQRSGTPTDAPAPPLTPEERSRLLKQVYSDTKLPGKPRNMLGLAKDIAPSEMEALLKANIKVTADEVRDLAQQRALVVRDALLARGLTNDRLFLAAPKTQAGSEAGWTPGVDLSLSTR